MDEIFWRRGGWCLKVIYSGVAMLVPFDIAEEYEKKIPFFLKREWNMNIMEI